MKKRILKKKRLFFKISLFTSSIIPITTISSSVTSYYSASEIDIKIVNAHIDAYKDFKQEVSNFPIPIPDGVYKNYDFTKEIIITKHKIKTNKPKDPHEPYEEWKWWWFSPKYHKANASRTIKTDPSTGIATVNLIFSKNGYSKSTTYKITGFKITSHEALKNSIQVLNANALNRLSNPNILASEKNKLAILNFIKSIKVINNLTDKQKNLLILDNILLSADDSTGTLKVTITGHGEDKIFTITRFKTQAKKDAESKVSLDKAKFSSFNIETLNNFPIRIANGKVAANILSGLDGHSSFPPVTEGVVRSFEINTDEVTGIAMVTITFSSGTSPNKHTDTKSYRISGFETSARTSSKASIALDKTKFSGFDQSLVNSPNQIENGSIEAMTLENLEGHSDIPEITPNVNRSFIIITNNVGVSTVTITFESGGVIDTISYQITGFSSTQDNIRNAQSNLDKLTSDIIKTKPTQKQKVNYNAIPTASDLNFPSHVGYAFTFARATAVDTTGTSIVTFRVVSIVHGVTGHKDLQFNVLGFQTKAEADIVAANNAVKRLASSDVIIPPTKQLDSNVHYGSIPKAVDIIYPSQAGFVFKFLEATPVNTDGEATITFKVGSTTLGATATSELAFNVLGFQTKAAFEANRAIESLSYDDVVEPKLSSSVNYNSMPKATNIDLPKVTNVNLLAKTNFAFKFLKATLVDAGGKSIITFRATSTIPGANAYQDLEFEIAGFETKAKADIRIAEISLNALEAKDISTKPSKLKYVKIGEIPIASDLNKPRHNGYKFSYVFATLVNDKGESIVTYNVNSIVPGLSTAKALQFKVTGFETRVDLEALALAIKGLANNLLDSIADNSKLPSTQTKDQVLAIIKNLDQIKKLTSTQQSMLGDDDITLIPINQTGELRVLFLNHGPKDFKISGFQTTKQKDDLDVLKIVINSLDNKALDSFANNFKLPSLVTEVEVLIAIKNLASVRRLTIDQKNLFDENDIKLIANDRDGVLNVQISNHGSKTFNITGFQTTKQKSDLKALEDAINDLRMNELEGFANKSKLPLLIKKAEVLIAIKNLAKISKLTTDQKNLLGENDIRLVTNNSRGRLLVVIKNHGRKVLVIKGFQTTKQKNDLDVLANAINSLNSNALNKLANAAKAPSLVKKAEVLIAIKNLAKINKLTNDQKNLLDDNDLILTAIDKTGTLQVEILNHGNKFFVINNFQTTTQKKDLEIVKKTISDLDSNALEHLANNTRLPSLVKKEAVLNAIKNIKKFKDLTQNQKNLLNQDDITLVANDTNGELQATIKNYGNKVFIITSFQTTGQNSRKIVENFVQKLKIDALNNIINANIVASKITKQDVVNHLKNFESFQALNDEQKSLFTTKDIELTPDDPNGILRVTIINYGDDAFFEVKGFQKRANNIIEDEKNNKEKGVETQESSKLSTPQLIAIGVGSAIGLSIASIAIFYFIKKRRLL